MLIRNRINLKKKNWQQDTWAIWFSQSTDCITFICIRFSSLFMLMSALNIFHFIRKKMNFFSKIQKRVFNRIWSRLFCKDGWILYLVWQNNFQKIHANTCKWYKISDVYSIKLNKLFDIEALKFVWISFSKKSWKNIIK